MPSSWESLGVDVRGRSHTLRINYRTSHQIRLHTDRLLRSKIADVDGDRRDRRFTQSVFNSVPPLTIATNSPHEESQQVADWINECLADGVVAEEIILLCLYKEVAPDF